MNACTADAWQAFNRHLVPYVYLAGMVGALGLGVGVGVRL